MAQIQCMFNNNKQLDESKIVDLLTNKAPRKYEAMIISQFFDTKTGDLVTIEENCERADTTNNIAIDNFLASHEYSDTMTNIKRSLVFLERLMFFMERRKKSSPYCSLHRENTSNTSRECKVLNTRDA